MSEEKKNEPAFGAVGRTIGGAMLGGLGLAIVLSVWNAPQETADNARDASQLSALDIAEIRAEADGLRQSISRIRDTIEQQQNRLGAQEKRLAEVEARFEERSIGVRRDLERLGR
tara:strand:- start:377 stop:721 length:345 start_codon:yes stop_codon:yes gene_type:complete